MKTLVDKLLEGVQGAKKAAVVGAVSLGIGAGALGLGAKVAKSDIVINSFADFAAPKGVQTINTERPVDDFRVRDLDGVANVVNEGSHWHVGFINYIENSSDPNNLDAKVVGYAENKYRTSVGWEGHIKGVYIRTEHDGQGGEIDVLGHNEKPEDVWIVHDGNGDGMGVWSNGSWNLNEDDTLYYSKDIEFNGIQGDVSQLPATDYIAGGTRYLPQMTIDARSPRNGPAGINELLDMATHWLEPYCDPDTDCDGADWNFDGKVDYRDFAYMAVGSESCFCYYCGRNILQMKLAGLSS